MSIALDDLIALRDLSLPELRARFDVEVEEGVRYERLRPVTMLHAPVAHAGRFYFDGDRQVMLYVGAAGLEGVDPDELERELGGAGTILRSRAGASSVMHVYPDRGVAFSSDGDVVEILEVFQPTTLDAYRFEIYDEPAPFIR